MLPNVRSKPMAEVLGPPVFLFKGRLKRRETKNQSAGFLPNPERAYLERPRHKQSWDKSNILSSMSKESLVRPPGHILETPRQVHITTASGGDDTGWGGTFNNNWMKGLGVNDDVDSREDYQ